MLSNVLGIILGKMLLTLFLRQVVIAFLVKGPEVILPSFLFLKIVRPKASSYAYFVLS